MFNSVVHSISLSLLLLLKGNSWYFFFASEPVEASQIRSLGDKGEESGMSVI